MYVSVAFVSVFKQMTFLLASVMLCQRVNFRELVVDDDDSVPLSVSRDGSSLILLPKQLWCSSNQEEEQGETWFQVGWLLDRGLAITSKCSFSADARLKASPSNLISSFILPLLVLVRLLISTAPPCKLYSLLSFLCRKL